MFFTTPRNRVIALDPETGRELWTFDPQLARGGIYANMWINRGVAYWRDAQGDGRAPRACSSPRSTHGCSRSTRRPEALPDFGANGTVNLRDGIAPLYDPHEYNVTSPGTVVGDVIAVGSSIADTLRPDAPPGDVRGFDVRTGALRWTFHTIPHAGEPGSETWEGDLALTGAANVWSTITADLARGWLFLPVSTASPDFYGGDRPARICTAIPWWRSRPPPGSRSGTSRPCTTISGTTTSPRPPCSRRCRSEASGARPSCRRPNRASCSCSTAQPARRSTRSRSGPRPRATCPVSVRGRRSQCRRRRRRSFRSVSTRRSLRALARASRLVPRAPRRAAQRRTVHAAERARIGALPVHRRWRELVGGQLRIPFVSS
jgi:hypothetical protein